LGAHELPPIYFWCSDAAVSFFHYPSSLAMKNLHGNTS
jgi:hypothetical protein